MGAFVGEFALTRLERVISGPGTVSTLPSELERLGRTRAVIVTGRTLGASPLLERVIRALGDRVATVFTGAREHVPDGSVCDLAGVLRETAADCVVSFGGGSPIDTAKAAIHALLDDTRNGRSPGDDAPIHIAIPTTLSAGEFTAIAGVTDPVTRVKRAVADPRLAPRLVIMDAELTLETPDRLWAASGIRALDHAIESIYSNRHHPLSDALATRAIRMLVTHLPASIENGDADRLEHRSNCQMAAWLSVFGMINAGFGLSHVFGHQIGPRWNVPHGITSCIMLPHAMRFMARLAADRFGPIAEGYGLAFDATDPMTSALACADRTRELVSQLHLPSRLRDVNVPRNQIDDVAAVVHEALEDAGAVDRRVAREELLAVLADAY
jgi:alcohol dehydrogenase class IV